MKKTLVNDKIEYCFVDRTFGDSTCLYARYKYSDQHTLQEVEKNRQSVASIFGQKDFVTLKQVHGSAVIQVEDVHHKIAEIEADAMVTTNPSLLLGIQTADCVPVLFSCKKASVVGAAHCGWRSARADIIKEVKTKMQELGAEGITAVIGPAIAQESYEIDQAFYEDFLSESSANEQFFRPSSVKGKHLFNLPAYVRSKLSSEDIYVADHVADNTYTNPVKYPSRRRSFHKGEQYNGNILSLIMIA